MLRRRTREEICEHFDGDRAPPSDLEPSYVGDGKDEVAVYGLESELHLAIRGNLAGFNRHIRAVIIGRRQQLGEIERAAHS